MSDLISRQSAIELVHTLYPSAPTMRMNRERWKEKYKPYIEIEKALAWLPHAQPEQKKGQWRRNFSGNEFCWYCSLCKEEYYEEELYMVRSGNMFPNFCPNCGADMRVNEMESEE